MIQNIEKISIPQFILLMMGAIGVLNHVIVIPILLEAAKRDSWISVIFNFVTFLILAIFVYMIQKATDQQNIFTWIKENFGKKLQIVLIAVLCIHLFILGQTTFMDTLTWTKVTYLPISSKFIMGTLLALLVLSASYSGIRTIVILNGVILPIVIILGFFVSSANLQYKNFTLLKPFLENGLVPVLEGMIYSGGGIGEFFLLLLLLQHRFKDKIRFYQIVMTLFILSGLTIGPTIGALTIFGPEEAARQRYPAYEEWAMVSLGRFVEHVDFLSIYQWMSGVFIRLSTLGFIISELFQAKKGKKRLIILATIYVSALITLLFPISDIDFLKWIKFTLHYSFYFTLGFITFLFILILIEKVKRGSKHGGDNTTATNK
ncbi:endospore germination permease [Aeribacillus alveayuensis]|uniref:Spore germination protein (Amino acid permease) n=1 Tax=Aeribacillus alveayuensis TaxID=279215 RepID=A0ABT9VMC8_9BACI|nr:spore germination protein (amino acid permease) [Bacillus alveayuensis]